MSPINRAHAVRLLERLHQSGRDHLTARVSRNLGAPIAPKVTRDRGAHKRPHPRKDPAPEREPSDSVAHVVRAVVFGEAGSGGKEEGEEEEDGGEEGDEAEEDLACGEEAAGGEDVVEVDGDAESR